MVNITNSAGAVQINDGIDTLLINTDGSLNTNNVVKSLLSARNSTIAYNNSQTIYTVPAGKTAKIYSFNVYHTSIGVAATNAITLTLGSYVAYQAQGLANTTMPLAMGMDFGGNYILLTGGQTVTIATGSNGQAYASVQYLEENV